VRLFAYFARAYVAIFLLVQLGLVVIVVATTMVENAGYLSRSDEAGVTALLLSFYSAVQFGYQVLPVACFLAALITGTVLARSGELLAVQAAGLPPLRVGVAFFVVALVIVMGSIVFGETLVPRATARLAVLQAEELGRGDSLRRFYTRRTQWFRKGDLLLYLPTIDPERDVFTDVRVYRFAKGLIVEVIEAERLTFPSSSWQLESARIFNVESGALRTATLLPLGLDATPRDLVEVAGDPHVMSSHKLSEITGRREAAGFDATVYRIERHSRLAFPLTGLCMFLLAAPWMLSPDRRRSLAVNLGSGVVVVAVMLALTQVFRFLALARRLPVELGAWGLDAVALACVPVSLALRERVRRRGSLF
jgi:lipopolysaccharide export system permease protein